MITRAPTSLKMVTDMQRITELENGVRVIETNKQLAALAQIHAAIWLFRRGQLECAVTLAGAAEGVIPPTAERHLFLALKNGPLAREEFDYNDAINWLKHPVPPDEFIIPEFEAAIILVRAISKFFTVYKTGSPAMKSFVRWTFEQGHLPMPSLADYAELQTPYRFDRR